MLEAEGLDLEVGVDHKIGKRRKLIKQREDPIAKSVEGTLTRV
jgi:hypothetical protein